jgi:multiple sugar transport system substrate-binding protein
MVRCWTERLGGLAAAAAFLALASPALAQDHSAADRAVEAAKAYAGETVTVTWEAGLQALDPLNYSGPLFEDLTGVKVEVIEIPVSELFTKTVAEHRAGTGAYDLLNVVPAWMPDLVNAGVLAPIDEYVDKYEYREDLQDIADVYRENQMTYNGKIYGLPDDGDVLILYYRTDLFGDEEHQAAYREVTGRELAPPKTWDEFYDIAAYFDDALGDEGDGAALIHAPGLVHYIFEMRFRTAGGKFFDAQTMEAQIGGEIGVAVLGDMVRQLDNMPEGAAGWGPIEVLNSWLAGDVAMTMWWAPPGRWSAGYGAEEEALSWLPESQVAGEVGYALPPGGHPELAAGFSLAVAANSDKKELAYLFAQWLNSQEISLERVMLPYALRDPFRTSHFQSEEYRNLWPSAPQYLDTLQEAANSGLLDLSIIDTFAYEESLTRAIVSALAGGDPASLLADAAEEWDELTEDIGVEDQRAAYQNWASKPGAYPE